jgi:beta-lactam-binding protein with PASTA domain
MCIDRFHLSRCIWIRRLGGMAMSLAAILGGAAIQPARAQGLGGAGSHSRSSSPRAVVATIETVDWNTGSVRLTVPLLAKGSLRWKTELRTTDAIDAPVIKSRGREVVIDGRMIAIEKLLKHGTRSLWLEDDNGPYRVDLPAVELMGYRHAEPSGTTGAIDGPQCSWTARHLLPGFTFWLTRQEESDARPLAAERLPMGHGAFGFIREVRPHDGGWEISLGFPHVRDESLKSRYHFTLINPDGSKSRTMAILRHGNTLVGAVELVAPAHPIPVDEPVPVPRVALHSVAEAIALTDGAHLVPTFVDFHDGRTIRAASVDPHALVLRQGLAPGEVVMRGQVLVLTVKPATRLTASNDSPADKPPRQGRIDTDEVDEAVDIGRGERTAVEAVNGESGVELRADLGHQGPAAAGQTSRPVNSGNRPAANEASGLKVPQGAATVVESSRPSKVRVPVVKGKTRREASALLGEIGLTVVSDGKMLAEDVVTATEPGGHAWVAPGARVELMFVRHLPTLAGGQMPKLFNQTLAEAEKTVEPLGIRLVEPSTADKNYATRPTQQKAMVGTLVIERQSVPAGRAVHKNEVVSVTLVRLVAPTDQVQVPRLLDDTLVQAEELAHHYGLAVRTRPGTRPEVKQSDKPGFAGKTLVERQDPAAGTRVAKGARIEVVLVHYRDSLITVPSLRGLTPEAAALAAEKVGLVLKRRHVLTATADRPALAGKTVVSEQVPDAGKRVALGAVVEVDLERYSHRDLSVLVPQFAGKSLDEASREARQLGLELRLMSASRVSKRPTENVRLIGKTVVDWQSIAVHSAVAKNTVVEVRLIGFIEAGTSVPDFRGMTLQQGMIAARNASLTLHETLVAVVTPVIANVGKLVIENQSFIPKARVKRGTIVEITVARYTASETHAKVPNLQNLTVAEAGRLAAQSGVVAHFPITHPMESRPTENLALVGKVVIQNQSIVQGQTVNKGTVIENNLVQYHSPGIAVPRFLGMTIEEAQAQGQAVGLAARVRPMSGQRTRWAAIGERPGTYVETQSSPMGTVVPRGTTIEVTLVRVVLPRTRPPRR